MLDILTKAAGEIRKQCATHNNFFSGRALRGLFRGDTSQIVMQAHFQGLIERQRNWLIRRRPSARAALVRTDLRHGTGCRNEHAHQQEN